MESKKIAHTCCDRQDCEWADGKGDNDHKCPSFVESAVFAQMEDLDYEQKRQVLANVEKDLTSSMVEIQAPSWAWDTIMETLCLDMESSVIPPRIREELSRAVDALELVQPVDRRGN